MPEINLEIKIKIKITLFLCPPFAKCRILALMLDNRGNAVT